VSVEVRREEVGVWREGVDGRGEVIVDMVFRRMGRTLAEGLVVWRSGMEGDKVWTRVDRAGVLGFRAEPRSCYCTCSVSTE